MDPLKPRAQLQDLPIYDNVMQFKRAGDSFRLIATVYSLLMIWDSKKSTGFSGKSQVLFAIVYTARYFGAYKGDIRVLNGFEILLRITLLCSTYFMVYLIYYKFAYNSSREQDKFRIGYPIVLCGFLGISYNTGFADHVIDYDELRWFGIPFVEIGWAFSYYLEAVAILPQLMMQQYTRKNPEKQDFVNVYLKLMCVSRLMYSIYSIIEEKFDVISAVSGVIQLCSYLGYFWLQGGLDRKSDRSKMIEDDV
ncbi:ER lumen protein-retaining receptor erd-2.2-like [Planococcus citri]|uniref:ER lumen protein-retaining receptor erd-2.2-like n=1 Tax=Planococcus citri TaxID=170843 RepID=UPI0031F745A8